MKSKKFGYDFVRVTKELEGHSDTTYIRTSDVVSIVLLRHQDDSLDGNSVCLAEFVDRMEEAIMEMEDGFKPLQDPVSVIVCYNSLTLTKNGSLKQELDTARQWGFDIMQWMILMGASANDLRVAERYVSLLTAHEIVEDDEAIHGAVPPMRPEENVQ